MTTLMDLLLTAPESQVPAVQDAMRAVAKGEWRAASRIMSHAADWTDRGDAWGDAAEKIAAELRTKADHS